MTNQKEDKTEVDDDENVTLSFPLERTSAMRFLGIMWTGYASGQILVSILLLIGVLFLGNQKFSFLSIFFFVGFILPVSIYLHRRMVSKGRKLMRKWCDIKYKDNLLYFKTGFPNTMNPEWQSIKIEEVEEENQKIILKGEEVGGYHLRINHDDVYRFGLWLNFEDANSSARELAKLLNWQIVNETRDDKSV